jgi:hypothetical protein
LLYELIYTPEEIQEEVVCVLRTLPHILYNTFTESTLQICFGVPFPYSTAQCYPHADNANLKKIVNCTILNYIVLIDAYLH